MSIRMTVVHWIKDGNVGPTKIKTGCGKDGWKEAVADEYTTGSNIFEAVVRPSRVTCKTCIKVLEKSASPTTTMTSEKLGGEA